MQSLHENAVNLVRELLSAAGQEIFDSEIETYDIVDEFAVLTYSPWYSRARFCTVQIVETRYFFHHHASKRSYVTGLESFLTPTHYI